MRGPAGGPARECHQGDTVTNRVPLDQDVLAELPGCRALAAHRPFRRLIKFCAAHNAMPYPYIQRIGNHAIPGGDDPQRTLHSDTFQPTIKAWLLLGDVDEDNDPFSYVRGSHRLTPAQSVQSVHRHRQRGAAQDRAPGLQTVSAPTGQTRRATGRTARLSPPRRRARVACRPFRAGRPSPRKRKRELETRCQAGRDGDAEEDLGQGLCELQVLHVGLGKHHDLIARPGLGLIE